MFKKEGLMKKIMSLSILIFMLSCSSTTKNTVSTSVNLDRQPSQARSINPKIILKKELENRVALRFLKSVSCTEGIVDKSKNEIQWRCGGYQRGVWQDHMMKNFSESEEGSCEIVLWDKTGKNPDAPTEFKYGKIWFISTSDKNFISVGLSFGDSTQGGHGAINCLVKNRGQKYWSIQDIETHLKDIIEFGFVE